MGKRKVFEETWKGSGSTRLVMRTQIEFFFGIEEIASAFADRYHEFERAEDMLSVNRRRAMQIIKSAFKDRGSLLGDTSAEELLENSLTDVTLEGKSAPMPVFIGALYLHIKKLFPELVTD